MNASIENDKLGRGETAPPGLAHAVSVRIDFRRWARRVLIACVAFELALVAADYHLNFGGLIDVGALKRLFNIAREDGLASWFQTTQTLMAATTLWLLYSITRAQAPDGARWIPRGWLVLALLFTYMAVDDGAQIHERVASTVDALGDGNASTLSRSYTWQVLFLPPFAAVGLFLFVFLWRELHRTTARVLLVFAMGCLGVAVGLDFIEGLSMGDPLNVFAHAARGWEELRGWSLTRFDASAYKMLRHFSRSVEEGLEMLAISVLWCLFIAQLAVVAADVRIRSVYHY